MELRFFPTPHTCESRALGSNEIGELTRCGVSRGVVRFRDENDSRVSSGGLKQPEHRAHYGLLLLPRPFLANYGAMFTLPQRLTTFSLHLRLTETFPLGVSGHRKGFAGAFVKEGPSMKFDVIANISVAFPS